MRADNRPFVATTIVSAVLLGAVLFLHLWKDIPIVRLTGDPADFGGVTVYTGFLSQAGILLWAGAATVCLFCGTVLPRNMVNSGFRRFLLISGFFTLYLALDDVFMLHELVFPYVGIPQNFVLGSYIVITLGYLVGFHRTILATNYRLLICSLFFFAVSVTLDVFKPFDYYLHFFEDGAKLIGIVSWMVYFVGVGEYAINSAYEEKVSL